MRLDGVGDFILTTPAIREMRANYPAARITLVVSKRIYPLAELCPYVNEVLAFDTDFDNENFLEILKRVTDFARAHLWKRHYILGINFRYLDELKVLGLLMLYISGAKKRVGYVMGARGMYLGALIPPQNNIGNFFLTNPVLNPKEVIHDCAWNLYLLSALGLSVRNTSLEVWYDVKDFQTAKILLKDFAPGRIKIAVGIGGAWEARRYPIKSYLKALKEIVRKGAAVVIMGGSAEAEDAKFLQDNLPSDCVKNLAALRLGWRVDAAAISQTDMYIGNDTGTQHIAAALHVPIILLSRELPGQASVLRVDEQTIYFPWQVNAIVLHPKNVYDISKIEPKEIVAAYEKFVDIMKSSGIQKTSCPPVIRMVQQDLLLHTGFISAFERY